MTFIVNTGGTCGARCCGDPALEATLINKILKKYMEASYPA